jgi:hypothetical protein
MRSVRRTGLPRCRYGLHLAAITSAGTFSPIAAFDAAVAALVVLVVGVQGHDLVAEEPGGLSPPVRDQGLGRGQCQLELLVQVLGAIVKSCG